MFKPKDQAGMVSILTVMLLAVVLAISTTGFLRLMLRSNRQVQDASLSSQAYYAAETGIEDAVQLIRDELAGLPGTNIGETGGEDCAPGDSDNVPAGSDNIDGNGNAFYSCQIIDKAPFELNRAVGAYQTWLLPIKGTTNGVDDVDVSTIEVQWTRLETDSSQNVNRASNSADLPPHNTWISNGTLAAQRFQVMFASGGGLTRSSFSEFASFVVPQNGGGPEPITTGVNYDDLRDAACSGETCTATITLDRSTVANDTRLLIKSLYRGSDVRIRLFRSGGIAIRSKGAQARIDVTGRSGDVSRRLEAYVQIDNGVSADYSVQSADDICKLLRTRPGVTDDECVTP